MNPLIKYPGKQGLGYRRSRLMHPLAKRLGIYELEMILKKFPRFPHLPKHR